MKLGRVRLLMVTFAALALVLLPIAGALQNEWGIYAGLFFLALASFVWFLFYRCPRCHKFLWTNTKSRCPYCKERL